MIFAYRIKKKMINESIPQPVVILKKGPFKGERAVLHWKSRSGDTWRVRLLDQRLTVIQRMNYGKTGKVDSVTSYDIIRYVRPADFTKTKDTALPEYQTWNTDSLRLLKKYEGKTKAYVERDLQRSGRI